jgi:hypothetical protein
LVNRYHMDFNPNNSCGIKHLITINITQADPKIFEYLFFAVEPIGRLVSKDSKSGEEFHKIKALVKSSTSKFLGSSEITIAGVDKVVLFDYKSRNMRCNHCLSYTHTPSHCFPTTIVKPNQTTAISGGRSNPRNTLATTGTRSNPPVVPGAGQPTPLLA